MIKSNEFRVGNIVFDYDGEPTDLAAVEILAMTQCEIANTPIEFIKPIPLTEEWLEMLGLEPRMENAGTFPCFKKGSITIGRWGPIKWKSWFKGTDIYKSPQHVHQLQNLHFALTGEELKLNP